MPVRRPDHFASYRTENNRSPQRLVRIGRGLGALLVTGLLVAGCDLGSKPTPNQSYTYTIPEGEKLFDIPAFGTSCGTLTKPRQVTNPEIVQGPPGTTERFVDLDFEDLAASAAGDCGSDPVVAENHNHNVYVNFANLVNQGQS